MIKRGEKALPSQHRQMPADAEPARLPVVPPDRRNALPAVDTARKIKDIAL
jgi:hypothetical protein